MPNFINKKSEAFAKLTKVLNIEPGPHEMTLFFSAEAEPEITITRILTEEEIEAVADFFKSEDLEPIQYGETNYILQARDPGDKTKLAQQVDILNNSLNASANNE